MAGGKMAEFDFQKLWLFFFTDTHFMPAAGMETAARGGRLLWESPFGAIYSLSNSNSNCFCSILSCSRMYLRMVDGAPYARIVKNFPDVLK
jgi:hypothetical protein